MKPIEVVQSYFKAMQAGEEAADDLFGLFADHAVYIEPFSGESRTHEGKAAIETCLRAGWENTPPGLELEVNRIDVDGDQVRSEWTCTSPAFEAPIKGIDQCTVSGGRIVRLEVRFG